MSAMTNITVKASDGTTDVVYTALTPSAGDRSPAKWRANANTAIPGNRPTFSMITRDNGDRTARRVVCTGSYPITAAIDGVETQRGLVPFELTMAIPQLLDADQVKEAVYQFTNLCVSTLVRGALNDGYAPT